jgi:hypothetical protein
MITLWIKIQLKFIRERKNKMGHIGVGRLLVPETVVDRKEKVPFEIWQC